MQFNTVLIVYDTLRKDFIFPYNSSLNTPSIRKFVSESTVFPSAISPASWTPPAHASIFTGKYPSKSGIHEDLKEVADFSFLMDNYSGKTLSEVFRDNGYNTYKYSQNGLIGGDTGYSRGFQFNEYTSNPFQFYYARMVENFNSIVSKWGYETGSAFKSIIKNLDIVDFAKRYIRLKMDTRWLRKADKTDKGGLATVENIGSLKLEEPFFLFINLMDMHDPHDNISLNLNWQDSFFGNLLDKQYMASKIKEGYGKAALRLDSIVSSLLGSLKRNGYLDNTVIAMTSDHGQAIFEEAGYYGHGNLLLDKIIEVPFIVKIPGKGNVKYDSGYQSTARIYDYLPSVALEGVNYDNITSEVCFSESYGTIDKNVSKYKSLPDFPNKYDKINSVRKAVYKNGFKLVVDLSHGSIEEFKKDGKSASLNEYRNELNDLVEEIKIMSWGEDLCFPV